jgi:hypothetical protein
MHPIKEAPTLEDEKGAEAAATVKAEPNPNLEEESNRLFDEAQALGNTVGANVDRLVALAKSRKLTRAVVGGPRTISAKIAPRKTLVYKFQLFDGVPCAIGFRANVLMRIQVVRRDYGHIWMDRTTVGAVHSGVPGGKIGGKAPITIQIHNPDRVTGQFQLFVN